MTIDFSDNSRIRAERAALRIAFCLAASTPTGAVMPGREQLLAYGLLRGLEYRRMELIVRQGNRPSATWIAEAVKYLAPTRTDQFTAEAIRDWLDVPASEWLLARRKRSAERAEARRIAGRAAAAAAAQEAQASGEPKRMERAARRAERIAAVVAANAVAA